MLSGWIDNRIGHARALLAVAVLLAISVATSGQTRVEVDLALVLAIDCSYSVNDEEFRQQTVGLAEAFRHPDVVNAIASGPKGRIAVVVVQWSGADSQQIAVPWTIVDGPAAARELASLIEGSGRQTAEGATSISAAINVGTVLLLRKPFDARRMVIDISGDGDNNNGGPPDPARDRALAAGIAINGLVILNDLFYLDRYYENHVVGGSGSFVIVANDYGDYGRAILLKLIREIEQPLS